LVLKFFNEANTESLKAEGKVKIAIENGLECYTGKPPEVKVQVVKTIKENPYFKIRIEGFTDNIGPKEYNVKLAYRRAESVKKYLVSKGVPEEKIEIVGFGKERYIESNEDPIGRLTNRRVEFIVIKIPQSP